MKFEEVYPQYKPLIQEGLIKEVYYNDKESICRFGNAYALFNYEYKDICVYVNMLSDLYMLAFDPNLLMAYYKQKKLSSFNMTPDAIDAIRRDAAQKAPDFNSKFERLLSDLFKAQQKEKQKSEKAGRR